MLCHKTSMLHHKTIVSASELNYFREEDGQWKEDQKLEGHSDWVRDVAWAPSIGLPKSIIASCSQVIRGSNIYDKSLKVFI